jgi:hypothetical protein
MLADDFFMTIMAGIAEFTPEFFDTSSMAWRANKVRLTEGTFRYKRNAFSTVSAVPKAPAPAPAPAKKAKKFQLRRSPRLLAKAKGKTRAKVGK